MTDRPQPQRDAGPDEAGRARAVSPAFQAIAANAWRLLVVAAAVALVAYVLIKLRLVVLPVIVAMLVCTLLVPPANWLRARGWRPLLATWAVLLATVLVAAGLFAFLGPQVADQLDQMGQTVKQGADQVLDWLTQGPLSLTETQIEDYVDQAAQRLRENSSVITGGLISGALAIVEVVVGALLTLVLIFFFLKDGDKITGWIEKQFPSRHREHVVEIGRRAWASLAGYVRGTAIVALVDATLIGILLAILGVPLVIPLVVLTFFGAFFPLVGATIAGAIAALVALVTEGVTDALIVTVGILAIQQIEGDVLLPLVLGRAVRLHPVVILLTLTSGAILGGIAGAFLAVPLTAVVASVGSYLRSIPPQPAADAPDTS